MSAFNDILSALTTKALALSLPTAWENEEYDPAIGTLYIRPTILPASTEQAGLGANGLDDHIGVYQIDVFAPVDGGRGIAVNQADAIADHFARGQTLTYNGVDVRIGNVSRGAGAREDSWYKIPVFINYQSFTLAR